jgi:hypothetical protein
MSGRCTHEESFQFHALPAPVGTRYAYGRCHVRIFQDDSGFLPVLVISDLADNPGPEPFRCIDQVATQAWSTLLPALEQAPVVVLHHPCDHPSRRHSGTASFWLITFRHQNPKWRRVGFPIFERLDYLALASLVGESAGAELAVWRCRATG